MRGRSRARKVNYRTSHQIRAQADRLLGRRLREMEGSVEGRTVSVLNVRVPQVRACDDAAAEQAAAANWPRLRVAEGLKPQEMAVFVRTGAELRRTAAAEQALALGAVWPDCRQKSDLGERRRVSRIASVPMLRRDSGCVSAIWSIRHVPRS